MSASKTTATKITLRHFGTLPSGEKVTLYILRNARGMEAQIINYGGVIRALKVPDKRGHFDDVVLGFDSLPPYLKDSPFFGTLVGRYANRIAGGKFSLDGKEYTLATNNGANHLHGGEKGFDKAVWKARPLRVRDGVALELRHFSLDGDAGYPGNLSTRVVYTLDNKNQLRLDYFATTDAPSIVNLTNHSYFNLAGRGTILNHRLRLYADAFTPTDTASIPLGFEQNVSGTPFDFRRATPIGARINQDDVQLKNGQGFDHNFVLNQKIGQLSLAACVEEPMSGRVMRVYTTEPGVQLYTGNFLSGKPGKRGRKYPYRGALCLETQHAPDSPNQPAFPSVTLRPGQTYRQTTIFAFSTR